MHRQLDLAKLGELTDGDLEVQNEVIAIFLGSIGKSMADLESALVAGELRRLAEIAHRLRGGLAVFARQDLVRALEQLEATAVSAQREQAEAALKPLLRDVAELVAELQSHVVTRPP